MNRQLPRPVIITPPKDRTSAALLASLNGLISQVNSQVQGVGTVLASAPTLALTNAIHHVSGTAAIKNIMPTGGFTGPVWLIPDGLWTTVTGGNIGLGTIAVVGKALTMVFDGTKWWPSY